ncbi:MAG: T9SS type A sorting domain-containing protein [Sphingobacteriales bacterium]|nr:MAG: T9SS type A sorting domain-containing protein [Sphingobacteriales bacterium]
MKIKLLFNKLSKLTLLSAMPFLFDESVQAQCLTNTSLYPSATVVPAYFDGITPNEIASCNYEEEYAEVKVNANQYHIFYSSDPDTYITISNKTGTTALTHGTGQVGYTSTVADTVRVYFNTNANCGTDEKCITTNVIIGSVPTCYAPLGINHGSATGTAVTFNWNAASPAPSGGYEYYFGDPAMPPTATTTPSGSGTATSAAITLTPSTDYGFWVRSVCGTNDKSNWSPMINFSSQYIVGKPWAEGLNTNWEIPEGFIADGDYWFVGSDPGYIEGNPGDFLGVNQYAPEVYEFETINISGIQSNDSLNFDYRYFDYNDAPLAPPAGDGYFKVYISTNFGQTYTQIDSVPNNTTAVWTTKSYQLGAYAGQIIRVKIEAHYTSASGMGDYILGFDNFSVDGEDCANPSASGINVTNNTPEFAFEVSNPQDADSYAWNFGDGNNGTGQSTTHTYTANGNYTVTVTLANDCGTVALTESVTVSGVSINDLKLDENQLKLFPNPAKNNLKLENLSNHNMKSVTVYNILGQKMDLIKVPGTKEATLNLSKYANGIYSLVIEFESGTVTRKFEVVK